MEDLMSRLKRVAFAASMALAVAGAGGMSALAQDHHDFHHGDGGGAHGHPGPAFHGAVRGFHGHDFAHFTPAERTRWVGGGWHHDWHNGRFGWWWAVGPAWYFYTAPIYPYPDYVAAIYDDPTMGAPPPPVAVPAGAASGYWYYCQPSGVYYPYVQSCPAPWTQVTPTPPQAPQQ
jgi:hypothetical protein